MSLTCPYCAAPVDPGVVECAHCGSALELPVQIGDLLDGRFEIRRVLGFGPLGTTYTARDRVNKCDLVLKVISPSLVPSVSEAEMLGTQLQMFEGRSIQGCAMHLEVRLADDILYLTYPRVDGVTLREVLDARAALNQGIAPEEALRLLLAIVSATSALHSATPHGALRPENVMLTHKGVVLTNGAIVGSVPPERIQPRLRAFARAAAYVAPEVLAGKKVTATADLYAIGAIAAELLSGMPSPHGLEEAGLSPELVAPIRQLLDRDRTKRPGGQGTLLNVLSKQCGFDRRPPEPPLVTVEPPQPSEDDSGEATTIAPAPVQKRETAVPGTAPAARAAPVRPNVASGHPNPNQVQTQPTLPVARVGIGRPINAPGAGGPPLPAAAARPSTPSVPSIPVRPRSSAPPVTGVKTGTSAPPPPPSTGPASVGGRPSIPGARPPLPSLPKVPGASSPVAPPAATLGSAAPAPRVPRIPGIVAPPAAPSVPSVRAAPRRNFDDIDPKLLQAAQELHNEESAREFTELDTGEIELLDE